VPNPPFHSAAVQDIDFLPASFHQKRQRRRKALWRRLLHVGHAVHRF
jgi:hypothetical protein